MKIRPHLRWTSIRNIKGESDHLLLLLDVHLMLVINGTAVTQCTDSSVELCLTMQTSVYVSGGFSLTYRVWPLKGTQFFHWRLLKLFMMLTLCYFMHIY